MLRFLPPGEDVAAPRGLIAGFGPMRCLSTQQVDFCYVDGLKVQTSIKSTICVNAGLKPTLNDGVMELSR